MSCVSPRPDSRGALTLPVVVALTLSSSLAGALPGALLNSQQISLYDALRDPSVVWHLRIDMMPFESVPGRDVTVDVLRAVRPPRTIARSPR